MSYANKTARISTKGYYSPHALYEPIEPCEVEIVVVEDALEDEDEEPQEQEVDSPAHAPAPTPEPLQKEPEVEEDVVEVIEVEDDEEEDTAQEDVPPAAMGWTTKIYDKPRCDSSASHHRV